jgi:hypothetical protein
MRRVIFSMLTVLTLAAGLAATSVSAQPNSCYPRHCYLHEPSQGGSG